MKRFIGILSIIAAIGIVAVLTILHVEPEENDVEIGLMQVNVVSVQPQKITDIITGHGQVKPRWETTISSEVNGRVLSVSEKFLSGAEFSKDDVLAVIDDTAYVAALEKAKAVLTTAKRKLKEEQQRSKIAADNWKSSGFKSKPSGLVLRQPQLEEAKIAIEAGKAAVKKAEYDLAQTKITVPYDGVVVSRNINPGDFLQIGIEVGKIYDRSLYEVSIPLSINDIARLSKSDDPQDVVISSEQGNDTWLGIVSRIEQVIDQKNRWQNVVVEITETQGLLPGAFVRADFTGNSYENVLVVPENMPSNNGYLWYVDVNNSLQRFMPEILFQKDGMLFVKSPFETQDPLHMTIGQDVFFPDVKVQVNATEDIQKIAGNM